VDLSVNETVEFLGVSKRTIYRWVKAGTVPYSRVGAQYRFNKSDLEDWAATRGHGIENVAEAVPDDEAMLLAAVREGGIYYNIDGQTPEDVFEEIVTLLRLPVGVTKEDLLQTLVEREHMSSTGIGHGVAIPHPRNPFGAFVRPQLPVAVLREPVDWKSIDGQPVRVILLPLSPGVQPHLRLLSRLHYLIRSREWTGLDLERSTRSDILSAVEKSGAYFAGSNKKSRE